MLMLICFFRKSVISVAIFPKLICMSTSSTTVANHEAATYLESGQVVLSNSFVYIL